MPGAGPDTMAATVATPLERHLGIVADVIEMTSKSTVGISRITLQFNLNRSLETMDPIVVIGASAGGLEPLRRFIAALPGPLHGVGLRRHAHRLLPEHAAVSSGPCRASRSVCSGRRRNRSRARASTSRRMFAPRT
jgi:hypothetical protein